MIVPMKRVALCCLKEEREPLLRALQACGEIMLIPPEDAPADVPGAAAERERQTAQLLQQMKPYREKRGMLAPRPVLSAAEFAERQQESLDLAKESAAHLTSLQEARAKKTAAEARRAQLAPWRDLPVSAEELARCDAYTAAVTGFVPTVQVDALRDAVRTAGGDMQALSPWEGQCAVVIVSLEEDAEAVAAAARRAGLAPAALPVERGLIADAIAETDAATKQAEADMAHEQEALQSLSKQADRLDVLLEQYRAESERESAPLTETAETVVIDGWVRGDRVERLEKAVSQVTDVYVLETRDPAEGETPPVALDNNRFVKPFETITDMFSSPGEADLDPNPVMAPWYWLIFGMMMGDAGYGLLMVLGAWGFAKFLRPRGEAAKLVKVIGYSGFTTMLCGVLFGSYFGVTWHPVLFSPLDDPLSMLLLTIVIGVLHIFSGMILKMILSIRAGRPWDAVFDQLSWMVLLTGIGVLFLYRPVGIAMMAIGAVTVLLTAGRAKKGIGKVTGGLLGLYDITSYVSDILSYSRILALSLASGVVGMVMNLLAGMLQGSWYTFPFSLLVYVVGHVFNVAMSLLSAYVHDSRLQYIEFFNKFYEGGGRKFTPFAIRTQTIDVRKTVTDARPDRS